MRSGAALTRAFLLLLAMTLVAPASLTVPATAEESVSPAAARAVAQAAVGIEKENSLAGQPLVPGGQLTYTVSVRCSGLTAGCVNQRLTDVLPAGLDVTSLPTSTNGRTVHYDEATRTLTVDFIEPLQEPAGSVGLKDGATRVLDIGMRLPAQTQAPDGTPITNTATTRADNADEVSASSAVTVDIPREVRPVVTKTWSDGSAVAGSAETSTVTLGIRNASSSSVAVRELRVTDATLATYESFDLTRVELGSFPAGADTARLLVCTTVSSVCSAGDYVAGAPVTAAGALPLPGSVSVDRVTGFVVVFESASGAALPYDATGGVVRATLELRDTVRSTGAPLEPVTKRTVSNCAAPTAVDENGAGTQGASVCAPYDVLPATIVLSTGKTFVADANASFARDNGEYAVVGEGSPVSAVVRVQNVSPFALREIRIVEPDAGAPASEFDKLDVSSVRLRFPSGATSARLEVRYADGTDTSQDHPGPGDKTVSVSRAGTRVSRIEVVYTGENGEGAPAIATNATAQLGVHGRLNTLVTANDLAAGTSPGVGNCAVFSASADTSNGTGTTSGSACASLAVEARRLGGAGTKSVTQNEVPPGEPIRFSMSLTNNGNVPLVDPMLLDPPVEADGTPRTGNNPFDVVGLTSASVTKDSGTPPAIIEVFDPTGAAWKPYAAGDTALLGRSRGVRLLVDGELTPTKKVTLHLVTERRADVPDGVTLRNCFQAAAATWGGGDPACAAEVITAPAASAATINTSIAPGQLPAPIAGVPRQTAQVRQSIANTGNTSASRLGLTDADADFFDAVDFAGITSVVFPAGANRVQIDALTTDGWQDGRPVGTPVGGAAYGLPSGVSAGQVRGVRATFTNSAGGYLLTPCVGTPTPVSCTGVVQFGVHPRTSLRSEPEAPVPDTLDNILTGGFETRLQEPGNLASVGRVDATLSFVEGDPQLSVDKTPNSAIAPGESAPFELKVTNSGTADLPGLVVKDLLPAGLIFDESLMGDGGEPFKLVAAQVPAGTESIPTPRLTQVREGGRVTELHWSFGDWVMRPGTTFTLQIQVGLAPGVTAGLVSTNLMGASATAARLGCAPGSALEETGSFGPGRYCTDSAAVTTKAGAAFQARTWVAGNDALGWYDNRAGKAVAVGGGTCPSLTERGRTYTAYPCVALVSPGDRYDNLLRLVNAGTESATSMVVIDRFPVQGDKGVVLSGTERGTQWNNRPILASAPELVGSGELTTTYAHSEAGVCTGGLSMTGACPSGAWADPFGPAAVAAQMRVRWQTPLVPGGGVSITFAMDTPLEVERRGDPTIAWNSFGHAETTLRANGQPRVLSPTEPIQVGVATTYGTLRVSKELIANPGGLPVGDRAYPMRYECRRTPIGHAEQVVAEGSLSLKPGESSTVSGIPAGATCEVWETDPAGGVSNHPVDAPAVVTIEPQLGTQPAPAATVRITNSFPLADLRVVKSLAGGAAGHGVGMTFKVEVACTMGGVSAAGFPRTVDLVGNDEETVQAPVGSTCVATETESAGATRSTVKPAGGVLISADPTAPQTIEVTNTFERGRLQIRRLISGAGGSLPGGPFGFRVACSFLGTDLAPVQVSIPRSGSNPELVADVPLVLPVGAVCTVTETDTGGADERPQPVTVTIVGNDRANTVQATFTNRFSAGVVALTKTLAGDGATADYATGADFVVAVTCAVGAPDRVVHSAAVEISGGERLELTHPNGDPVLLPLGSRCWAVESETGGASAVHSGAGSWSDGVEVLSGSPHRLQEIELEVTNTFEQSSIVVDKAVTGAAGGYAVGREYEVEVTCVLPQDGVNTPLLTAESYPLTAGTPLTVDDLPVGAECWVAETDAAGATESLIDFTGPESPVVVDAEEARHLTVTNRFDAGGLTVRKRVVGGGPGPYSFEVACSTGQGAVALAARDAAFSLRGGAARTIRVPLGASCKVREVDVPEEASVTFQDSDRRHDGVVRVAPQAAVTVVNTFADHDQQSETAAGTAGGGDDASGASSGDGSTTGTDGLPGTGGPRSLWLALGAIMLVAGGALILGARRRARSAS